MKYYYCPKCKKGHQDQNSKYCKYCAAELIEFEQETKIQTPQKTETKKLFTETDKKTLKGLGVILAIILVAIIAITAVKIKYKDPYNQDGLLNPLVKSATINDINHKIDESQIAKITFLVTPNKNINKLKITFSFENDNGAELIEKTKTVGNVVKGYQYKVSFELTEFNISILGVTQYTAIVTGGTTFILT